jgi:DeoR/GlpR family transcriptional regulator of sugar metabolism
MLSQQRQKRILEFIRKQKSAQVTELSDAFGVSVSTVRRDLSEMELRGLLQRVHGGAILTDEQEESPLLLRASAQADEKARIGEAAAQLVHDGETIIITSGTTTAAILPYLTTKNNLTVITNVITVAHELAHEPHITVIVLGGWLRHSEFSLLGHLTMESLRDLRASAIFHGTYGLDIEHGLTGTNMQEVETDRRLIAAASELIVLADSSKFRQIGPIRLAPIERISTLITDSGASEADLAPLRDRGINVIVV